MICRKIAVLDRSKGSHGPRAGHSELKTTNEYIELAGVLFADEVPLLEDGYAGAVREAGTKSCRTGRKPALLRLRRIEAS
jgi:hypothetical protein